MILWFILIIIAIVVLFVLWWYTTPSLQDNVPTLHARCKESSSCGGDLTCDLNCRRCKKQKDGHCATDVDCETGLTCQHWKCLPQQLPITSDLPTLVKNSTRSTRKVHWDDTNPQFFPILN